MLTVYAQFYFTVNNASRTCKGEEFNQFISWIRFGDGGTIGDNNMRFNQGKILKFNHLLTNMLIFHTVERLKHDGFADDAIALSGATVHWLRHTDISDDVKRRPLEHVRDDAGHSSGAITDRYIDIELRERHASAKKTLIKN